MSPRCTRQCWQIYMQDVFFGSFIFMCTGAYSARYKTAHTGDQHNSQRKHNISREFLKTRPNSSRIRLHQLECSSTDSEPQFWIAVIYVICSQSQWVVRNVWCNFCDKYFLITQCEHKDLLLCHWCELWNDQTSGQLIKNRKLEKVALDASCTRR